MVGVDLDNILLKVWIYFRELFLFFMGVLLKIINYCDFVFIKNVVMEFR